MASSTLSLSFGETTLSFIQENGKVTRIEVNHDTPIATHIVGHEDGTYVCVDDKKRIVFNLDSLSPNPNIRGFKKNNTELLNAARSKIPVTKPVEPVKPVAKPVEQASKPVAKPVEQVAKPVEPVKPVAKPVEPIVEPVKPVVEPVEKLVVQTEILTRTSSFDSLQSASPNTLTRKLLDEMKKEKAGAGPSRSWSDDGVGEPDTSSPKPSSSSESSPKPSSSSEGSPKIGIWGDVSRIVKRTDVEFADDSKKILNVTPSRVVKEKREAQAAEIALRSNKPVIIAPITFPPKYRVYQFEIKDQEKEERKNSFLDIGDGEHSRFALFEAEFKDGSAIMVVHKDCSISVFNRNVSDTKENWDLLPQKAVSAIRADLERCFDADQPRIFVKLEVGTLSKLAK